MRSQISLVIVATSPVPDNIKSKLCESGNHGTFVGPPRSLPFGSKKATPGGGLRGEGGAIFIVPPTRGGSTITTRDRCRIPITMILPHSLLVANNDEAKRTRCVACKEKKMGLRFICAMLFYCKLRLGNA